MEKTTYLSHWHCPCEMFYYYNKDHLGNNRELVTATGIIHQVTDYTMKPQKN